MRSFSAPRVFDTRGNALSQRRPLGSDARDDTGDDAVEEPFVRSRFRAASSRSLDQLSKFLDRSPGGSSVCGHYGKNVSAEFGTAVRVFEDVGKLIEQFVDDIFRRQFG